MLRLGFNWLTLFLLILSFQTNNSLAQDSHNENQKIYYVSNNGDDNKSGLSPDLAWKTLTKLQAEIDARSIANGNTIAFKAGDKFVGSINLGNLSDITLIKYESGANPILTGLIDISGSWSKYKGNIYRKAIKTNNNIKYLTINGVHYLKGRYPNRGFNRITTGGSNAYFVDAESLTQIDDYWNGAEIFVRVNLYWWQLKTVTDYTQSTHRIDLSSTTYSNLVAGYGYFFQNSIKCLLDDGDWYFSGDSIYLYYSTDPSDIDIQASICEDGIITASGDGIFISDLNITGYNRYGIYSNGTDNNNISNNDISYCSRGIFFNNSDTFTIENNSIHDISLFGIRINKSTIGTIDRNVVTNIGMNLGYGNQGLMGILIDVCDSIMVYKNDVDSCGYGGINVTTSDRLHIYYNRIRNYCQLATDGGGIHAYKCNKDNVSNYHRNYWNNNLTQGGGYSQTLLGSPEAFAEVYGLYMDGGSTHFSLENNLSVYNSTNFHINNTKHSYIRNNWTLAGHATPGQRVGYEFHLTNAVPTIKNDSNIIYNNKWITNWVDSFANRTVRPFSLSSLESHNAIDSNYYIHSTINRDAKYDTIVIYEVDNLGIYAWRASYGGPNEKTRVITWSDAYTNTSKSEYVTYDYNFSDFSRSYNFEAGWTYYDIYGKRIKSKILDPYEGVVLFRINNKDHFTVTDIPDQTKLEGNPFASIDLNDYIINPAKTNDNIIWTYSNNNHLNVTINPTTMKASILPINPEWIGSETITFSAINLGGLYDSDQITFTVSSVNNPPEIENQEFVISLKEFNDNYIGRVLASDPDSGHIIKYTIISGNESGFFLLDPENGDLRTSINFNVNQSSSEYNLIIRIEDNGEVVKSDTATIKVSFIKKQLAFYIDPANIDDPLSNGTLEHPFGSWNSITWEDSCTYLQKKSTTSYESKINIYASNVTIGSYGEGETPVIQSKANDFAIRAFEKNNLYIKDLHIIAQEAISCIYILGSTQENRIENCILEGAENGVRIIDSKSITICYNTIIDCSSAIFSFAEGNKIFYNIFRNNQIAINITSLLASTEIYNNVFYGNHTGISVSYSDLVLYNNIFYLENTDDNAINIKMDKLISDNNIFYPEQEGFISVDDKKYSSLSEFQRDLGLDLGSFNLDPQFRDVYNNNFAVSITSPAIDAGRTVGLNMDFYGTKVPYGKKTDIGLAEAETNLFEPVTSVELSKAIDNQRSLTIFPNPSNGRFNINLEEINKKTLKASIVDLAGKIIYEKYYYPGDSELYLNVDISHIPKGIYLVILHDGIENYYQRIIIN